MKRINTILLAGISLLIFSCAKVNSEKTPEGVTERFVNAFNTADFQNMYEYSSKKSHFLIDNLSNQPTESDLAKIKSRKISIDSTRVTNLTDSSATCICYFKIKVDPESEEWQNARQEWDLAKEGENWKVLLVKP